MSKCLDLLVSDSDAHMVLGKGFLITLGRKRLFRGDGLTHAESVPGMPDVRIGLCRPMQLMLFLFP